MWSSLSLRGSRQLVWVSVRASIYMGHDISVCLFICLSICLLVCLPTQFLSSCSSFISPPNYSSSCLSFICPHVCLFVHLLIHLCMFIHPPIYQSNHPSIYHLSLCPPILSIFLFLSNSTKDLQWIAENSHHNKKQANEPTED